MTRATPWRALGLVALPPLLCLTAALTATTAANRAQTAAAEAARALADLRPQLTAPAPSDAADRLLVHGATVGVAAAEFHTRVSDIALLSGATLERIDQVATEAAGPLTRMQSQAVLSGSDRAIMDLVVNLEAAEPLILIDRLDLAATDPAGTTLRADLALSAYAIVEAP